MWEEKPIKRAIALLFIIVLTGVIAYALLPFLTSFFAAFILYVLFRPVFDFFVVKAKMKKSLAAFLVIILTIVLVLIPLAILLNVLFKEVNSLNSEIIRHGITSLDEVFPDFGISDKIEEQVAKFGGEVGDVFFIALQEVTNRILGYVIMYFVLFYLLVTNPKEFQKMAKAIVPFNKKNTERLVKEFKMVTYSTLIAQVLIAVVQGLLLAVSFLLFGINGAFFWGFVTMILSILPVVGPPVVWFPAAIFMFAQKNIFAGIGILVSGLIISHIDSFLRPYIQNRVGKIHPLVSLVGVIMGISLFGFVGLVLGPLLLNFFLLTVNMFKEEYVK